MRQVLLAQFRYHSPLAAVLGCRLDRVHKSGVIASRCLSTLPMSLVDC